MPKLLLTVKNAFPMGGSAGSSALLVAPWLDESEARATNFEVELRRPDGTTLTCDAFAQVPTPPPPGRKANLVLLGVSKDDVPIGAEVWTRA